MKSINGSNCIKRNNYFSYIKQSLEDDCKSNRLTKHYHLRNNTNYY